MISDLHLDPKRPEVTAAFLQFLHRQTRDADALYILGDLFEAWIGDDNDDDLADQVASALAARPIPKFFMHGNRDFLLGADYAARCGMQLLNDPCVIDLYGERVLLMHGDLLCTDDAAYQAFRTQVRDPQWQQGFLAQPLAARRAFAAQARAASAAHQSGLANMESITDVTPATVDAYLHQYGVTQLIHGHTHRPAVHTERGHRRIVLGDWYDQGSLLEIPADGEWTLQTLPIRHGVSS